MRLDCGLEKFTDGLEMEPIAAAVLPDGQKNKVHQGMYLRVLLRRLRGAARTLRTAGPKLSLYKLRQLSPERA